MDQLFPRGQHSEDFCWENPMYEPMRLDFYVRVHCIRGEEAHTGGGLMQ